MFYIQVDIANEWQFELEFWSSWPQMKHLPKQYYFLL